MLILHIVQDYAGWRHLYRGHGASRKVGLKFRHGAGLARVRNHSSICKG
jgi:hypothetical protein